LIQATGQLRVEQTVDGPIYLTTPDQRDQIRRLLDGSVHAPREYQRVLLADEAKFRILMYCRQSGKSHGMAMDDVILAGETGYPVVELSASLDQTKELILKTAFFAEAFSDITGEIQRAVLSGSQTETLYVDDDKLKVTQTTVQLPGGQRIIGRPANPRTARGFSAHVTLDEFALHRDSDEIWAACFPSINSKPFLRVKVASTPKGQKGKFYSLWTEQTGQWSKHRVTIHDAIRMGLEANPEELRQALGDDEAWNQEYLCEFVDASTAFLDYDLIRTCEKENLSCIRRFTFNNKMTDEEMLAAVSIDSVLDMATLQGGELYAGFDVARRGDLSVIWLWELVAGIFWPKLIVELKDCPFRIQEAFCDSLMALGLRRMCIDQTGIGEGIAESLGHRFGVHRAEPVHFSKAHVKQELAEGMRPKFQDRKLRIPVDNKLRDDFHSITRETTASGNVRYVGERNKDGHADRFWAAALGLHAAEGGASMPFVKHEPPASQRMRRMLGRVIKTFI
jgi:phage FluMu gp28-like protein